MSDFHVAAVVFHPESKNIALVRNEAYKGKPAGWGLPGGRSEEGDDAFSEESVKTRLEAEILEAEILEAEILEELGIRVRIFDRISSEERTGKDGVFSRFLYLAVAISDGDKNITATNDGVQETAGWNWYDPNNLPKDIYYSHRRMIDDNMEGIMALHSHYGL